MPQEICFKPCRDVASDLSQMDTKQRQTFLSQSKVIESIEEIYPFLEQIEADA